MRRGRNLDAHDQGRYELKYALPLASRATVLAAAAGQVTPDPHAVLLDDRCYPEGKRPLDETRGYVVHSLYFDTPRFDDYFERLDEARVRHRLRVRTYGFPGERQPVFLEDKRKLDDHVIKHRAKVGDADAWAATRSETPWLAFMDGLSPRNRLAAEHFDRMVRGRRRSVSLVHYVREVFVGNAGERVRLTLDIAVTATVAPPPWDLYAAPDVDLIPPDMMVLELKFDGQRPAWMRKISADLALRAEPVSKFGLSVAHGLRGRQPHELRYLTPRSVRARGRGERDDAA